MLHPVLLPQNQPVPFKGVSLWNYSSIIKPDPLPVNLNSKGKVPRIAMNSPKPAPLAQVLQTLRWNLAV